MPFPIPNFGLPTGGVDPNIGVVPPNYIGTPPGETGGEQLPDPTFGFEITPVKNSDTKVKLRSKNGGPPKIMDREDVEGHLTQFLKAKGLEGDELKEAIGFMSGGGFDPKTGKWSPQSGGSWRSAAGGYAPGAANSNGGYAPGATSGSGGGGYAPGATGLPGGGGQPPMNTEQGTSLTPPGDPAADGPTGLNMSDPLGMSFGSPNPVGGDPRFRGGYFPNAPSITAGLGPDSTVGDAISNVISSQEASRNAALGIYGGVAEGQRSDPTLQGARGLAAQLQANPFSLDDATLSRIQGQQTDLIGRNAERQSQMAGDRAAAQGMGRSGMADRAEERIRTNANRQQGDAQRGLLVEQATRRPAELAGAMQSTGQFGLQDYQQRTGIELGAADQIHGQTSYMGDALVSGLLMGQPPQAPNVAMPPSQGAFGSSFYSGPASRMPYYTP